MHKKGISLNSVEKSLSHSADKIRRRTLLCFEGILVSKSFKQRRGKFHGSVEIFFYLTGPEKLRQGTILCFRKLLVGKNTLWISGGGGITIFRRSFCLRQFRKFSWIGGGASRFYWNFVSQDRNEKLCKATLLFSGNFLVSKKIYG